MRALWKSQKRLRALIGLFEALAGVNSLLRWACWIIFAAWFQVHPIYSGKFVPGRL